MCSHPKNNVAVAFLFAGAISLCGAYFASTRVQAADLAIRVRGAAVPLDPSRLLASQTRLAFGLVRQLEQSNPRDNIVVSPASLAAVMALLDLGASARLHSAIHRTLGFVERSRRQAKADLDELRASIPNPQTAADNGPLAMANAIIFDPASAPFERALRRLRATGAEANVEDLSTPESLKRINDWVAARTRGLIPSILEQAPRESGLVALSALYFKDRWRVPFDPRKTRKARFHVLEGASIDVAMMRHTEGRFRFRHNEDFIAVDLPYATDDFALTIVTSRQAPLRAHAFASVARWLSGEGFVEAPGEVGLPRFSLAESAELLPVLDALGLRRGRLSPKAFTRFSPVPQVISRVVQKTVLRVDEAGTEAAAATAIMTTRSMPADFVKIVIDKPFVFALRDSGTGLMLLAGYVGRPTQDGTVVKAGSK